MIVFAILSSGGAVVRRSALSKAALLAVVLAATGCPGVTAPVASDRAAAIAFVDVNVVPMDSERVLERQTVVVRDRRIESIGPAGDARVPAGAIRIDGRGKYLMPGLAEMHAHIPGPTTPTRVIEDVLFLYLANGVTTIRGMLGAPNQLELRARAERGEIASPRMILAGPSLNGNSTPTPQAAIALVTANKSAGYDLQKVHPGVSRATYDSAVATASRLNYKLAGHVPAAVGLARVFQVRQDIDHLDGYAEAAIPESLQARLVAGAPVKLGEVMRAIDMSRIPSLAEATVRAGIYNAPTMRLWETLLCPVNVDSLRALPTMRYVPRQWLENWSNQKRQRMVQFDPANEVDAAACANLVRFRRALIKALADAGAPLLMATDSPQIFSVPGFSIHDEIALLRLAGLTPYQILRSGTANVARYARDGLGQTGDFGVVEVGRRGDLFLLDANPLRDLSSLERPAGVMVGGRWLSRADLDARLTMIAARSATP